MPATPAPSANPVPTSREPRLRRRGVLRLLAALGLVGLPLGGRPRLRRARGWILRADDR